MRPFTTLSLLFVATTLDAQVVPPAPPAPPAMPAPIATPAPFIAPRPMVDFSFRAEEMRGAMRIDAEQLREASRLATEQSRLDVQLARDAAREAVQFNRVEIDNAVREARTFATIDIDRTLSAARTLSYSMPSFSVGTSFGSSARASFRTTPQEPWAQQDVADSLYRQAREQLNRGDYRRAAALFKELPQKYPNSAYAADSPYWQAFALYRIGGTSELQEALAALEAQKAKYPSARTLTQSESGFGQRGQGQGQSQADASALAARIAGVLSTRGMSSDAVVKRALSAAGADCDREEQSVRAEALSALMQTDPESAQQMTKKILGLKDECSVPLRRNAVFIVGNKRDAASATTLISVAKSDPSPEVRSEAVNWLTRIPTDEALNALIDLSRATDDERVQRAAIRALTVNSNPKARAAVRSLVENNGAAEQLRLSALDAFDRDHMTADDASWLRNLYTKTDSPRIKGRIASAVGRLGGDANSAWLLALAKNEDESLDARQAALSRAGENLDIAALGKLYDSVSQRTLRETLINLLGNRKEPEAVDKLLDIVKTGTDPQLRRYAINVVSRKKDPRTTKLLMDIINK